MSISAQVNRTVGLLHRRLMLMRSRTGYLQPGAEGRPGPPRRILVLQTGDNPTVDYFLRPRLEAAGTLQEWAIVNTGARPEDVSLLEEPDLLVVVCRYITPVWLRALERRAQELHGLAYLVDDDLPAMVRDRTIPASARGRILRDYARHQTRLGRIATALWVTSPALAKVMPRPPERTLAPWPTEHPPEIARRPPALVVYHGGATHQRERLFVLEVARLLQSRRSDIRFEIAHPHVKRIVHPAPNVDLVPCLEWDIYRKAQYGRPASVMLAPLFDTPVNRARAPVKFLDAARMGAVGVYADAPVYSDFVRADRDGVIVPMVVADWAMAIERLIDEGRVRRRLAGAARDRVAEMFRSAEPLEFPVGRP